MTDKQLSEPSSTWKQVVSQSLRRQLNWRFLIVFLGVTVLGSLMLLLGYRSVLEVSDRTAANDTAAHIQKNYLNHLDTLQRSTTELRAQIDFMRIFSAAPGADPKDSWLQLRAFFGAMEGKVGRFPSGVVQNSNGSPIFNFGSNGPALKRLLEAEPALPKWHFNSEQKTVYVLFAETLWLGALGNGRLVLAQPLDNGLMRELAPVDSHLALVMNGQVVASSQGTQGMDQPLIASAEGRVQLDGDPAEQRVLPVLGTQAAAPRLVMVQRVREPVSTLVVLGASAALMAALALVLWLVLGRWSQSLTQRIAALSRATALFAGEHNMNASLRLALESAAQKPDEIGEVAQSCRHLMESVLDHDKEHFAYLQTLDILDEGVLELAPDGRYLLASPGWTRLVGQGRRPDSRIFEAIHPEDEESFYHQFQQLVTGSKSSLTGRVRLRRADSKDIWIEYRFVATETSDRKVESVRGVLRDITQSYQLEKHITHMALHDALTGLPNRVLLEDRAKIALRTAERNGQMVALGFIDLDHFKHVNDQFGHKTGDAMLVTLAHTMRNCLRAGDTLSRWGGDEFVVLLTEISSVEGARDAIAKIVAACEKPLSIEGNELNATFSMGVAMYPTDAKSVDSLLSQADRAMFSAKEQGRNTVRLFSDIAHRAEDRKALYIQSKLSSAIREKQIHVWFQPIVDATTRRVVSCEALARWHDETYGWVSPATFIPMAENLGLIREIGHQVWVNSVRCLNRWRELGLELRISVNVSRRQLFTNSFTADLLDDLSQLGISAGAVDLEITESVAMEDAEHTSKRLTELTQAGFGIAIDDFGTGFSSLSQLHDMPATKIKIDISFVSRAHEEQGAQLIAAIVKIASAFKLTTVAEGVEDGVTAQTLTDLGVDLLQGYHFGRPMDEASFERYLLSQPSS